MKKITLAYISFLASFTLQAQLGCNDPLATNYDNTAIQNDGSCLYNASSITFTPVANLPTDLDEISGMVFWNDKLYGHQDSGGPANLYEFDPATGVITKTIALAGATNIDWEDMTQDSTHFYIGDMGNNANGNRTDLKIYKFPKSLITAGTNITIPMASIEIIDYSYEDQIDFSNTGGNNTSFDCEALAYNRGKLHLFTKNWIGNTTSHYVLPTIAGDYIASKKETYEVGTYKITGAEFGGDDLLALVAYEVTGSANCALYLNYGFDSTYAYLNTGTMRRFLIGSAISVGQIEAVSYTTDLRIFIGNERFTAPLPFPFNFTVPQGFDVVDSKNLLQPFYENNPRTFGDFVLEEGMIRYNSLTNTMEGFDGTHWNPFRE